MAHSKDLLKEAAASSEMFESNVFDQFYDAVHNWTTSYLFSLCKRGIQNNKNDDI